MDPEKKFKLADRLEEAHKIISEVSAALLEQAEPTPDERSIGGALMTNVIAHLNANMAMLRLKAQTQQVTKNRQQ